MDGTLLWQQFLVRVLRSSTRQIEQMPREKALRLGANLGRLGFRVAKRSRCRALRNLTLAYGESLTPTERRALTERVFVHFGKTTIDFLKAASYTHDQIYGLVTEVEGWEENALPAFAQQKGTVAISGHLGNFEIFGRFAARRGIALTAVARDPDDPVFGAYIKGLRESGGYEVVSKSGSGRRLFQALKENNVLGILPDQNSGDVFVPFFGCPAGTPAGPAHLALRTGAPLLPAFCLMKSDNTYKIEIGPALSTQSTGDRDADTARVMAAVNTAIEAKIREYPEQWLWLHNRWKSAFEEKNRDRWPEGYDYATLKARWEST